MAIIYLNEQTAARRRVYIRLVLSSDGKSAATSTDVTSSTFTICANGGTPATSSSNIVQVNSTSAPGWWYCELTTSELAAAGVGNHFVRFKESDTLESIGGEFQVVAEPIWDASVARSGTAQAGSASTITLDSGASASDDYYSNSLVFLTGGAGAGQSRAIADYTGSSKVVTVTGNWVTNPDSTTTFVILPLGILPVASLRVQA
jgi:hypothetical protein